MTLSFASFSRLALGLFVVALPLHAQFTPPTPAELSMTSISQVPDAPAVYLFREETTEDALRMHSFYVRLKVLTEGGKEYANVELPYYAGNAGSSIDSILARTIQPDGSIVAFTGKPYDKLIEKGQGVSYKSKVFTLPAVQVGSILEYRYKIRYDDEYLQSPRWFIQSALYTMKAHYSWKPNSGAIITSTDSGDVESSLAWTPILPAGATVHELHPLIASGRQGGTQAGDLVLDLAVHDIPPIPHEDHAPPLESLSYRVLFYYTSYKTPEQFWAKDGKRWSKAHDKFMSSGPLVKAMALKTVAPGDSDAVKVKKIYDAIMAIENTDFTRGHTAQEDRVNGLRRATTADDILKRERGSSDELAMVFVSVVRAAGLKAYLMGVANRSQTIFLAAFLSLDQLEDLIAIVPVDGKEQFLDPGERYCTYGHLAWKHAVSGGLRQTDDGVKLVSTLGEPYTASVTKRVADLSLNEKGEATGTVLMTYTGDPALNLRQEALRGDDTSLRLELRRRMERMLPGGMEVVVVSTANLADADKPLVIKYDVKGGIGNATGKRLLVPLSLFQANSKPEFSAQKRELTVDMQYPHSTQEAVRIKYPASFAVEAVPTAEDGRDDNFAAFSFSSKPGSGSITLFRNVTVAKTFFVPSEYPNLHTFFGKLEAKQEEPLILTHAADAAKAPTGAN